MAKQRVRRVHVAEPFTEYGFLGFDPGASGAVAWVSADGKRAAAWPMEKLTEHDLWNLVRRMKAQGAVIERVSARPGNGVSGMFKFGMSFGWQRMAAVAASIPFTLVTPQVWMRKLGCMTRGDKNVTKARAQRLFPHLQITHAIADALLIAYYARTL